LSGYAAPVVEETGGRVVGITRQILDAAIQHELQLLLDRRAEQHRERREKIARLLEERLPDRCPDRDRGRVSREEGVPE